MELIQVRVNGTDYPFNCNCWLYLTIEVVWRNNGINNALTILFQVRQHFSKAHKINS